MPEPRPPHVKEHPVAPLAGSRRLNVVPWARPGDRQICLWAYYEPPEAISHRFRHQLSGARLSEVDRTSTAILLCNRLHEDECRWPGGEGVGEIDETRDAQIRAEVAAAGDASPPGSPSPSDEAPPREPTPRRRR